MVDPGDDIPIFRVNLCVCVCVCVCVYKALRRVTKVQNIKYWKAKCTRIQRLA